MERHAWKATVKKGMPEEHSIRHDEIREGMQEMLRDAGIRNYAIGNTGNDLFGYCERDSIKKHPFLKQVFYFD